MNHPLAAGTSRLLAAVPNPGQGVAPPGSDRLLTILQWAAWIGFGVCVAGAIFSGAMMAASAAGRTHGGGHHGTSLLWVFAGCIVIGSASGLVGALA